MLGARCESIPPFLVLLEPNTPKLAPVCFSLAFIASFFIKTQIPNLLSRKPFSSLKGEREGSTEIVKTS